MHGTLEEEIFIEKPYGFINPTYLEHVFCLKRALNGLKHAPRAWFLRLSNSLLDLGFVGSTVDTSLFTFHCEKFHVFLLIYMDDLLITGSCPHFLQTLTVQLKKEFSLKALGYLGFFLGIEALVINTGYIFDKVHTFLMFFIGHKWWVQNHIKHLVFQATKFMTKVMNLLKMSQLIGKLLELFNIVL